MQYYFAPMHGITEYTYRNSYDKIFHNIDKYFTPFIVPNKSRNYKTKDFIDVLPENNKGVNIIPQILTNDSDGFIATSRKLQRLGYNEVNLNLGCPSKIVVSKYKGSGFLAKREELDRFLDEIYKIDDMKISVKTRIGKDDPEEFYELIKIFNKYPMEELIIHPRTQKDFYGNKPNLEVFKDALSLSTNPICYNGDIFTGEDYNKFVQAFPKVKSVMLGRGILANPGLVNEIKNNILIDKKLFKEFHDELLNNYIKLCNEDMHVLIRMKELWGYMRYIFPNSKEYLKEIKKSQKVSEYREAVLCLLTEQEIVEGAGLFTQGNWGV
ncbi:tRNA dihydrouridine synthase [Oceanirhabdus sp. W0125-5]|uniref:tRNA dihydrouridine synthase n=1 Tax=Oceanirhabdus sp. W0125-5 TaxID=2999116 RepID=UPI0022F2DACF|nr:tRNA-dihydrouridine synthase family protein [Oceanirhabdus sp. W0125-5]WBW96200.1 tRNA-dihydrouridine synthase family protein [Oceanirhabdus sp. W0125-5]